MSSFSGAGFAGAVFSGAIRAGMILEGGVAAGSASDAFLRRLAAVVAAAAAAPATAVAASAVNVLPLPFATRLTAAAALDAVAFDRFAPARTVFDARRATVFAADFARDRRAAVALRGLFLAAPRARRLVEARAGRRLDFFAADALFLAGRFFLAGLFERAERGDASWAPVSGVVGVAVTFWSVVVMLRSL
jgi:hypothetical protein